MRKLRSPALSKPMVRVLSLSPQDEDSPLGPPLEVLGACVIHGHHHLRKWGPVAETDGARFTLCESLLTLTIQGFWRGPLPIQGNSMSLTELREPFEGKVNPSAAHSVR